MGNYLLKHFLSEKEPKEFKLTVEPIGVLDRKLKYCVLIGRVGVIMF
jgi:hypothetical protein